MPAALITEEAHAYLDSRPGWIILTSIGREGMPHTVPSYLRARVLTRQRRAGRAR